MKTISIFLAALLLFLSAFSGIANLSVKGNDCCNKMTHEGTCGHGTKECCNKGICGMMFSCSGCGFLTVQPVSISPELSHGRERPVAPSIQAIQGILSGYAHSGWHPPQV